MGETKQYTGAELKAWREKLGKDEAWIEGELTARHVLGGGYPTDGPYRRRCVEDGDTRGGIYVSHDVDALRTAYRAALEAEEARQRAQAEPACPEGVVTWSCGGGVWIGGAPKHGASLRVMDDGTVVADGQGSALSPAHLRYAAALSEYRARAHAEGDRQRKQDAVRAAEDAAKAAGAALQEASQKADAAYLALASARREAGQ